MNSTVAEDEVLAVLVEQQHEMINVSEVSKRSGVQSATANRVVGRQVATGLVHDRHEGRERLVRIDTTSPLYPSTAERLWMLLGVAAPPPRREPHMPAELRGYRQHLAYLDLRGRSLPAGVPEELRVVVTSAFPRAREDVEKGPQAQVVRAVARDVQDLARRSQHLIAVLEQTYERWHNERDRDLYHLLVSGSDGLGLAADVLGRDTARLPRQVTDRPEDAQVHLHGGALAWTLATYAVEAEAAHLGALAQHLEEAISAARELEVARAHQLEVHDGREATADGAAPRDVDGEVRAAVRGLEGYWQYRGAGEHVGAAGERALVIELEVIAGHARRLGKGMSKAECVSVGRHQHPQPEETTWPPKRGVDQERIERLIESEAHRYGQSLSRVRWPSATSDGSPYADLD